MPPAVPGGFRVLYATTALHLVAILDCPPIVREALWAYPPLDPGETKRPWGRSYSRAYHLVSPAFCAWARTGIEKLAVAVDKQRERIGCQQPAIAPDAIAPDPECVVQGLEGQLALGLERWRAVEAWSQRFMRPESMAVAEAVEPLRLPNVPTDAVIDRLTWIDIEPWTVEVRQQKGERA